MTTKRKITKEEREEHNKYVRMLERNAKKFRLTPEDLHNLHDYFYMAETPAELRINMKVTLKINNMLDWARKFHGRVERIVIPELYEDHNKKRKSKKKNVKSK